MEELMPAPHVRAAAATRLAVVDPSESAPLRTVVIAATIGMGALRIVWRALSPADTLRAERDWTADE